MITVCPLGHYAHRQPLAYAPIRAACAGTIAVTDDPEAADILVVAHAKDLLSEGAALAMGHATGRRVVLLSEEPLWDTVWHGDPLTRVQVQQTRLGPLPYVFLNHATPGLYEFDRVPYFLLTDPAFFTRYATWFARNARLDAAAWRAAWPGRARDAAFVAEYRDEPRFDVALPGFTGLGRWRTQVALACDGARVLRAGAGWNDLPRRQTLPDWHLEKFLDLDGRYRVMSAIENTHAAQYVSEKVFDAMAIGAVPACVAGPGHRLADLLPAGSWIELDGLTPEEAAAAILDFDPDPAFFERYAAAQAALARLFSGPGPIRAEYRRFAAALTAEFERVLSQPLVTGS